MGNVLYLDCSSGLAGDMLVAALVDLGADIAAWEAQLKQLDLGPFTWTCQKVRKNGFAASQFQVDYPPQHAHRHLHHIYEILDKANLSPRADKLARLIFLTLGQAEAQVHGTDLKKVHFHEVGAVDSIVDIVAIAILLDQWDVDAIYCSQVCTGFGHIQIAHGQVSVPAPATSLLLSEFPIYAGDEEGEMVTPTGAAVLSALATYSQGMPPMKLLASGAGAGQKDLASRANLVRAYLGQPLAPTTDGWQRPETALVSETLLEIQFQVDDMTGQELAYLQQRLLQQGVNDCYLTAVQMKKGRPGTLMTVHCSFDLQPQIAQVIFQNSSTIGYRTATVSRKVLPRESVSAQSPWGPLAAKQITLPDGTKEVRVEFEELKRIAEQHQLSMSEVKKQLGDGAPSSN